MVLKFLFCQLMMIRFSSLWTEHFAVDRNITDVGKHFYCLYVHCLLPKYIGLNHCVKLFNGVTGLGSECDY